MHLGIDSNAKRYQGMYLPRRHVHGNLACGAGGGHMFLLKICVKWQIR